MSNDSQQSAQNLSDADKVKILLEAVDYYAHFGQSEMSDRRKIWEDRGSKAREALERIGVNDIWYPTSL